MGEQNPYDPPGLAVDEGMSSPSFDSRPRQMPIFVNIVFTTLGVLLSLYLGLVLGMLSCGFVFGIWTMAAVKDPNEIVLLDTVGTAGATIMLLLFLRKRRAFLSKNYGPDEAGFHQASEPRDEQDLR